MNAIAELLARDAIDLGDRRLPQNELERDIEIELTKTESIASRSCLGRTAL